MRHLLHTKRLVFILILGIIIMGTSSCTKYSFMSMEDKIVGVWRFEKVSFIKGFSLSRRDVTKSYAHWEYEFTQDGRFYMSNTAAKQTFEGKWYMTTSSAYNASTESADAIYDVHVSIYNPDTKNIEQFVWEVTGLTGKRMRATEYFSNETWYYVMYRQ